MIDTFIIIYCFNSVSRFWHLTQKAEYDTGESIDWFDYSYICQIP